MKQAAKKEEMNEAQIAATEKLEALGEKGLELAANACCALLEVNNGKGLPLMTLAKALAKRGHSDMSTAIAALEMLCYANVTEIPEIHDWNKEEPYPMNPITVLTEQGRGLAAEFCAMRDLEEGAVIN
jgi:hypothetical protein